MKTILSIALALICLVSTFGQAQIVSLSYPINLGVIQRGSLNTATVTIAGQLISSNLSVTMSYRFRPVSATGVAGTPGSATNMTLAPNGMFYVLPVVSKGWYLCEILLNGVVYASTKFGVGDVFIIAGQSNAQGVKDATNAYPYPSSAGIPEWIIGTDEDRTCEKIPPQSLASLFSLNTTVESKRHGVFGPTGNGIWAYAVLGKQISDYNGGMPVAFFNAASGGTSITEWKQGSDGVQAIHPYTGNQMCHEYHKTPIRTDASYYGQPFTALKTALNFYGSLFGVRAVLWHQGETDADMNPFRDPYRATSATDYKDKLEYVISKARTAFGASGLTWYISKVSINADGPLNSTVRTGQGNAASGSPNNVGPDTDYVTGSSGTTTANDGIGDEYRIDGTHFYEGPGAIKGLTWLANKWYTAIGSSLSPIPAGNVPLLMYSKSGSFRTLTAPATGVSYKWNSTNINGAAVSGGTSASYTIDNMVLGIRCYFQDVTGNWHISPTINIGQYSSQREGVEITEEKQEEMPGYQLHAFPNPYTDSFTAEFYVENDNSQVKLEIIDNSGSVLRTIVNNSHAKGTWKYPVNDLPNNLTEIIYCRLKINENYTVKKLVRSQK